MALRNKSLFLYGYQVTELNRSIDFKVGVGGPELQATLTIGYYSLTALMAEIKRAMEATDGSHTYTVTADRSVSGGLENRITIATSGGYLSILFGTGSRAASCPADLIGFHLSDYTGATSYQGYKSSGTVLVTNREGYQYLSPDMMRKNFGSLNVSSSGKKEAIVFNTQRFWQVQFKYIPEATILGSWTDLMTWMIGQRLIEFTPDVTTPSAFYEGTLETTEDDGKGLGFKLKEMLPQFPGLYDTGLMKFRVNEG